jgi:hypothetical protein
MHLARLRWLGAAFCALAMLCATTQASALAGATAHARVDVNACATASTIASASEAAQTKTRVWGFDQNSPLHIWSLRSASAEQPPGFSPTLRETASGPSNAAEGVSATKHGLPYAPRVRERAVQDPTSHNFPYSYDDGILATKPIPKKNGYQIYQERGTMAGKVTTDPKTGVRTQHYKEGVFEIGVTKDGVIDHRFFRPDKL